MAIPDFQTLMLPVLRCAVVETSIQATLDQLAREFSLSQDERAQLLPSGRQTTFANRVAWAKTYLVKAGLVRTTGRGQYVATDIGRRTLGTSPDRIDMKYLERFPDYVIFKEKRSTLSASNTDVAGETAVNPEEAIRAARAEIESALATDLLDAMLARSPAFFEGLIVGLLVAMGYGGSLEDAGRALGKSGDGGVDGVIDEDALGLDRVYVQAKRYKPDNLVGPAAVRDFFGALDAFRANKGLFVTTSGFSPQAAQTAANLSKRIVLVDGARLTELMIRHDVGVRVIDTVPIKKIDEDYFDAE